MDRHAVAQLGGVRYAITSPTPKNTALLALALLTCDGHRGTHHFAVTNEGRTIAVGETGRECLQAQGVDLDFSP